MNLVLVALGGALVGYAVAHPEDRAQASLLGAAVAVLAVTHPKLRRVQDVVDVEVKA